MDPLFAVPNTDIIEIPEALSSREVMDILHDGHSYEWMILLREPRLVATGAVPDGRMPELVLIGRRIILTDREGHSDRLQNLLDILKRRERR